MAKKPTQEGVAAVDGSSKIKVQGMIFSAPVKYKEGDVLTALEAKTLNQTLHENLRNNFSKNVKKAQDEAKAAGSETLSVEVMEKLHADFAAYAEGYTFAERKASVSVDPVEKLAYKLAGEAVRAALKKKNYDVKTVPAEKLDAMILGLIAKDGRYTEEAQRRVNAESTVATDALDELLNA